MAEICNDNRFELIEEFKKKLIESTNIETSQEEMKVIDNILFRFWQMGWLESIDRMPLVKESAKTLIRSVGDSVSAKAFRNAGRFMQNAIDGEAQEYEFVQASSEIPNNSDTISRQDAIKDIRSMDVCVMYDDMCSTEEAVEKAIVATKRTAIFGLERMPSEEPKIIHCKDCRNKGEDECPMRHVERIEWEEDGYIEVDDIIHDYTKSYGYCDKGERNE